MSKKTFNIIAGVCFILLAIPNLDFLRYFPLACILSVVANALLAVYCFTSMPQLGIAGSLLYVINSIYPSIALGTDLAHIISICLTALPWVLLAIGFLTKKHIKMMAIVAGIYKLLFSLFGTILLSKIASFDITSFFAPVALILIGLSSVAENNTSDQKKHLEFLKNSLEQGAITEDEYEAMKKEYLNK